MYTCAWNSLELTYTECFALELRVVQKLDIREERIHIYVNYDLREIPLGLQLCYLNEWRLSARVVEKLGVLRSYQVVNLLLNLLYSNGK